MSMSYEIKTPMLIEAADAARAVIAGISTGTMDPREAREINSAAAKLISVVSTDVKARLAAPKITAHEAKLIESSVSPKINVLAGA